MEKKHRVEVLRALLEMHEQQREPDDEYIKGLRQRLKARRNNLRTCGHSDADGKIPRYFSLHAGTIISETCLKIKHHWSKSEARRRNNEVGVPFNGGAAILAIREIIDCINASGLATNVATVSALSSPTGTWHGC